MISVLESHLFELIGGQKRTMKWEWAQALLFFFLVCGAPHGCRVASSLHVLRLDFGAREPFQPWESDA